MATAVRDRPAHFGWLGIGPREFNSVRVDLVVLRKELLRAIHRNCVPRSAIALRILNAPPRVDDL